MSGIPTKHIDGDVSAGRNVSVGGDVNIQGRTRVGHDLVVEGWLDAPNIKGAQKGLFASPDDLQECYPQPRSGWWALVGTGFPLRLYRAFGGKWNDTGTAVTAVNISGFDYIKEVEERIREEIEILSELFDTVSVYRSILSEEGLLYPGIAVEHKASSAKISIPAIGPDGTLYNSEANIGAVGNKAGLMLPSHVERIDANTGAVSSLRVRIQKLPVLDFAGTVEGVAVSGTVPERIQLQAALAQGLADVVFDENTQKFLLRISIGDTPAYDETWFTATSGETILRPKSEYAAGALFSNGGVLYAWDGPGTALCRIGSLGPRVGYVESRLARLEERQGDLSDISATLARHESRLGDLVYKTDHKLIPGVEKLTTAANDLAARVTALEDGTGGSGGGVGECGCGAIASERIEALFAEEPEGPADGEPVTTAQLDDLIDDGVAQTPVEAPPGEYRLDEDDINALIEDIFN